VKGNVVDAYLVLATQSVHLLCCVQWQLSTSACKIQQRSAQSYCRVVFSKS